MGIGIYSIMPTLAKSRFASRENAARLVGASDRSHDPAVHEIKWAQMAFRRKRNPRIP
jgi:hypothetical protein